MSTHLADPPEWKHDAAARERAAAALAVVDRQHAQFPKCALCGQRAVALDKFGLCSKTSQPHMDWRAGVRADMKAGHR